ncbi:MAG: glycosyltransferase, partial [Nitrospirae bacterium]|nr:glycosyltransferase [Nitrospirota bacterium]
MPVEVHQLLPNLDFGDAIGNYSLEIRDILRSRGYISNIYVRQRHPKVKNQCYLYAKHKGRSSNKNIVIFHHAIGSEVSEYVKTLPDKKIMIYHNITPAHFFANYDSHVAYLVKKGREELKELSRVPVLALGDSQYNADELKGLGYPRVDVLPIIVNFKSLETAPDKNTMNKYHDGMTNILFVGRVVPNKRYEDIIKTFYFYQHYINSDSRLFLAGSHHPYLGSYSKALSALVDKLGVKNVVFTGHAT